VYWWFTLFFAAGRYQFLKKRPVQQPGRYGK